MKVAGDARYEREQLEFEVDRFLRSKGWKHTSDNPISVWLWQATLPDGRVVLVDKETALTFQDHFDASRCICTEQDTEDHRETCPAKGEH